MSPDQAEKLLIGKVKVTNQMVTYSKSYFLKNYQSNTSQLIEALLDSVEAKKPDKVVIHPSVDIE